MDLCGTPILMEWDLNLLETEFYLFDATAYDKNRQIMTGWQGKVEWMMKIKDKLKEQQGVYIGLPLCLAISVLLLLLFFLLVL